jgi:hypothetical protein
MGEKSHNFPQNDKIERFSLDEALFFKVELINYYVFATGWDYRRRKR